jgi:hypothetical protein
LVVAFVAFSATLARARPMFFQVKSARGIQPVELAFAREAGVQRLRLCC